MRRTLLLPLVALVLLTTPKPATADITAFLGVTATPENRPVRGFAVGLGLLIVGFEFEYATIGEDEDDLQPALRTGSGNVLLQTPIEVSGVQLYATAGAGLYRERLLDEGETHVATNLGGGAKIRIFGPLRARFDYRVFRLSGEPIHSTYQRFYAGGNIAF
jgi:hypothetical protein